MTAAALRLKVLVVDDDDDFTQAMAELLREWGHDVHVAATGKAALEQAAHVAPDVIVLDLNLPDTSGRDLAPLLRQGVAPGRRLPFIMAATGADPEPANQDAFDAFLGKPFDLKKLQDLLARARAPRRSRAADSPRPRAHRR